MGWGCQGISSSAYRRPSDEVYLDPFHGGVRLSKADCAQLVREATGFSGAFQPEWLKPVSAAVS